MSEPTENMIHYGKRENAAMLSDLMANHSDINTFKEQFTRDYAGQEGFEGHAGYVGLIVGLSEALDAYEDNNEDLWDGADWYLTTEKIVEEYLNESMNNRLLADPVKVIDRSICY